MPDIAFLLGDPRQARNDNHQRLPRAFAAAGWQVTTLSQDEIRLTPQGVRLGPHRPRRFQRLWLVGMGRADTFLDRMQLLRLLPQKRFVTRVDALTYLHAKYAWWPHMPETFASADAGYLRSVLARGGEWVAKPAAGSFGRDVHRLRGDADGAAVLERLTAQGTRYCLLQRYVAAVEAGEKRTLVAGGRIIGSYLRLPADGWRGNLAAGAEARPTHLDPEERTLVEVVARELTRRGVGFAAVDTVYPYLMEVNLANPGGLETLERLYGTDPAPEVVAALT